MASGAHSICHGDFGRSQWRAAASHPFIFMWKRSDLETSDSFYLENWQFPPASQPLWMCCNPFLMLPTWNAVLQDKNFLALNEFSNELSFQNSEEMPSDTLGSAKQEGNGSSVLTVINRMWFVYSPHLLSPVPCQGCARMSLPAMAWRNPRFLSQYQILCQRRKWLQAKEQTKLSIVSWILLCFSGAFIILTVQLSCSWLQSRGNLIKWEGNCWVTNFKGRCVEKPL